MKEFTLKGHEYIELNNLLKAMNFVASGGEANMFIVSGEVEVNGETELRKRKKLRAGDKVLFNGEEIVIR
ncbi:MAG: RNA-binding S4 domain-containing protein [Cytophagales bacterium]|nr:RNA-binding S4 domain-containing protein [Cytophagales bacterium]